MMSMFFLGHWYVIDLGWRISSLVMRQNRHGCLPAANVVNNVTLHENTKSLNEFHYISCTKISSVSMHPELIPFCFLTDLVKHIEQES